MCTPNTELATLLSATAITIKPSPSSPTAQEQDKTERHVRTEQVEVGPLTELNRKTARGLYSLLRLPRST